MLPQRISLKHLRKENQILQLNKKKSNNKNYDMFIYFEGQLIPACKQKLCQCRFVEQELKKNQKVIYINESLDSNMFYSILHYFHGSDLTLTTIKQLEAFLDIVDFLGEYSLINQITKHVLVNIHSFDIFCLLELSYKFGLKQIFDTCMTYLQLDQFQQIKYNRFDFLQCGFSLFQIILRRHHILKIKGQIQGVQKEDIQQVIKLYCRRNKFDDQITNRLMKKYVLTSQNLQKIKNSLRLDKLACKNIMQSANIETDFFENQNKQVIYQTPRAIKLININNKRDNSKQRKYSAQISKQLQVTTSVNQMRFSDSRLGCLQNQQAQAQSVSSYNYEINIKQINQTKKVEQAKLIKQATHQEKKTHQQMIEYHNYLKLQQPESMASRISSLLNQYEQALNQHDQKYRRMRRNATSVLFDKECQSQQKNGVFKGNRLLNSFNSAQHNNILHSNIALAKTLLK